MTDMSNFHLEAHLHAGSVGLSLVRAPLRDYC